MKRFEVLIQQCDDDIRAGRTSVAKGLLTQINTARVPREFRVGLARLCRRAGLYALGLKLLIGIVYPKGRDSSAATPAEISEYAILLLRSGAVDEALTKLEAVDMKEVPEAPLFRAYGHFIRWEYAEAIPLLKAYLEAPVSAYALAVGKANLAYAWVELRMHQPALKVLAENIEWLEKNRHLQLLSNCYALCAQILMQEGDYVKARVELENARRISSLSESNDQFLVTKLDLILRGLETRSLKPFEELRALAIKAHDWEALREADLLSLKVSFQKVRFLHLFFGTHFPGFRERIQAELGMLPERSVFVLGSKTAPRFDLMTGEIDGHPAIKTGTKCHQVLEILLRDFYQPLRIAGFFSQLFPGEIFDIVSSPDRVHQVLRRTRHWIKKQRIPIEIKECDGFYSLQIVGEISFRLPLERRSVEHMSLHFQALNRIFADGQYFTAREARQKLAVSKTTAFRLMNWALEVGKIEKSGLTNRQTKYKISDAA